ncbi:probable E3 ubiquitin-protein ligase IRF2BPL [Catharus ustulatus]|uniref:probable E3 ubiquitin-protein ligase IRF2BPL n=1 Tax=Catharus ustulatus TaxID=91951 RepID=UPI00140C5695|nr:probable E3 ubiquitin-protein ligase IRF2BPL [Catharus ustulatus]
MAWRRQWCHLCELPKPPWAVVGDFSQAVCRGCANFEGAGRVELLLAAARHLRGHHVSPSVPKELGEALYTERRLWGHQVSPNVPKELREALYTQHDLQGHHEATRLALSPSVPKELGEALYTEHHLRGHHVSPSVPKELREALDTERHLWGHHEATRLALSPSVPTELSLCGRVPSKRRHHRNVTAALPPSRAVSPGVPMELSRHHATRAVSPSVPTELSDALCGRVTSDVTERRPRRHHRDVTLPLDVSPSAPTELSDALCIRITSEGTDRRHHATTRAVSPAVPAALQRHRAVSPAMSPSVPAALSAALAEAWPGKPRAVRERLSVLAGCAPFAVRLRRDHALVGRVLAFDAAPRAGPGGSGGDFELRLFAEYPCGSGSVYGALGLARRMFQDCPRAPGRSISSGYKYLEYEKRQGSGEWRLLAELFTESVRLFRRPPSPEALPQQQRCHLSSLSPLSPPPARRRRKACPESRVVAGEALSCGRCRRLLEDTHFVQCPAVPRHRFCFPCARRAIRARGPGGAVHCPSGGRCPLAASGLPWAFMQGEIAAILAGDVRVKRERDP